MIYREDKMSDAVAKKILDHIKSLRSDLDEAERYLSEGREPNALGVCQLTALRIDQLCAVYSALRQAEKSFRGGTNE